MHTYQCRGQKQFQETRLAPAKLQRMPGLITEYHSSIMSGHFLGVRLYNLLCKCWYWEGMYTDCLNHVKSSPQYAVAKRTGRRILPSLKPITVSRVFQIVGMDIMELPKTQRGSRYVVVFQNFLSKWLMVFPVAN